MSKVLVLHYSMYGHTADLAAAVAKGAHSVPGTGGGNETMISSFHTTLFHHGMIVVGLPYSAEGLKDLSEVRGGSPLGAGMIGGADGSRQPNDTELELGRFQGRHVATVSAEVIAGRRSLAAEIHSQKVIGSAK